MYHLNRQGEATGVEGEAAGVAENVVGKLAVVGQVQEVYSDLKRQLKVLYDHHDSCGSEKNINNLAFIVLLQRKYIKFLMS